LALTASRGFATTAAALIPGDLLVADNENGTYKGEIIQVNPVTGAQSVWASGGYLVQPDDLAFDGKGNLIVADFEFGFGKIFSINIASGAQTLIASGNNVEGTTSLAIEAAGTYLVTNYNTQMVPPSSNVIRIDPATGNQTVVLNADAQFGSQMALPLNSALDQNGNLLIANVPDGGGVSGILNINSQTGATTVVSSGGIFSTIAPRGIYFNPAHPQDLLVTCDDQSTPSLSELLDVNISTGAQKVLATGGLINYATAVTEDSAGDIFVADQMGTGHSSSSIIEISAVNGAMSTIASGGNLSTPQEILFVPVPEPASLGIVAVSSIAMLMRRERKEA